jgi:hypothetical protein
MEQKYLIFILGLAFVFFLSCIKKREPVKQCEETFQKEMVKNSELDSFFYRQIKMFHPEFIDGVKDYLFIFKTTDINDTIFNFSYYVLNKPKLEEPGYKGFVKIDTFHIAIFDENNVGINLYKDKLCTESITFKRKECTIQLSCIGCYRHGKLKAISDFENIHEYLYWGTYFDYDYNK